MMLESIVQGVVLSTLVLQVPNGFAGIIHTVCAYLVTEDEAKALDVIAEAVIAASDIVPHTVLRMVSAVLCAICAIQFARTAQPAEAINSTTDGLWAAALVLDPDVSDGGFFGTACRTTLTAMAAILFVDSFVRSEDAAAAPPLEREEHDTREKKKRG